MDVHTGLKRREVIGILTAGAAGARLAEGQAPAAAAPNSDAGVQAARLSLQRDAQRIAMVKLPSTSEPAFRFRP
jgi:hypothetical protein